MQLDCFQSEFTIQTSNRVYTESYALEEYALSEDDHTPSD